MATTKGRASIELDSKGVVRDKDGVPTSIRVFKPGDNWDSRNTNAVYDPKRAKELMKSNNRADRSVPFDIGHSMMEGGSAPAESHESHGWGTLRCDDTGVWIDDIKWSSEMRQKLLSRKFRFVSPTFYVDRKSKRIVDLLTVSLTNIPATINAQPITNDKAIHSTGGTILTGIELRSRSIELFRRAPLVYPGTTMTDVKDTEIEKRADDAEDKEPEGDKDAGSDKEVKSEDEAMDLSNVDVDSMSEEEAKAFIVKLIDYVMDLKAAAEDDGEDDEDDAEAEEAKRDIIDSLFKERLVRYAQLAGLRSLRLSDLTKEDRKLRANKGAARSKVAKADRQERAEKPYDNSIAEELRDAGTPTLGATDKDVEKYLAKFGHTFEKLGLKPEDGKVFGTNITSMARSHGKGN